MYLWKASVVEDTTRLKCSEINSAEIGNGIDSTEIIKDNRPKMTKSKIDIIAKEKQTKNANSEIYYTF